MRTRAREGVVEALIKKHPYLAILGAAVLAFVIGHLVGAASAKKAITNKVLGLIRDGKVTEAVKLLGGTPAKSGEEE